MLRSRSHVQLAIAAALAVVVVVVAIVLSSGGGGGTEAPSGGGGASAAKDAQALYAGIPQRGIRLGRGNAPATVIEIADLQCPFCAQYSNGAMPAIVKDYVRTGRVSYELHFRSFLGRDSVRAAGAAAEAAKENRMYQFADLFYRNQGAENSGYADAGFIRSIASQVPGLDAAKVVAAADDPLSYPAVRRGEEFARGLGSTGTPDFYLRRRGSDRLVKLEPQGTSAQAYEQAIDAALAAT